ncbi:rhomboid family membrane protein [Rutstroemia sp. NJR-2017a BVV2]|nr:rhomboid family membrane protein [Rutstroemia sp. NJR-2017a BVV2]
MATPTTTAPPPTQPQPPRTTPLLHNAALFALIACPILIALPPRKLDKYTFALMTCTFIGGNHLTYEYTGITMMERIKKRGEAMGKAVGTELPDGAKDVQSRLREELRRKGMDLQGRKLSEEKEKEEDLGIVRRVWMGGEGKDWKEKRDRREREALEEGKGYGDLIMEQIWEVWNGGEKKLEEVKEKDKEVVEEERRKKEGKK